MKTLFINLCVRPDTNKKIPNVGLAYIVSAADRVGHNFEILDIDLCRHSDEEVKRIISKSEFDIASFGALSSMYANVKNIASVIRKFHPKSVIVIGNTLATTVTNTVLEKTEVDVCVLGEGEKAYIDLIEALENGLPLDSISGIAFIEDGKMVDTGRAEVIRNLDDIPFLDYELFDMKSYLENSRYHVASPEKLSIPFEELVAIPVNTARGCPFSCSFCTHAFNGYKYRTRSPENIVSELKLRKEQYGINFVNFWDELTFPRARDAEEFADMLISEGLDIHWIASVRSELFVKDDRGLAIAKKLKKAGCHGLAFSLESGNAEILKVMNKKNTVEDFAAQCHLLHKVGIDVYTSIIVGFPNETPETIDDTFDVLLKAGVYPSVGFLQLLPGTPLYVDAINKGIITEEEYLMKMGDRQDLRVNLTAYDDEFIMNYTTEKLVEINQKLNMGLDDATLIKTGVWKGKGKIKQENFMENFGVSGKILRESSFTKDCD